MKQLYKVHVATGICYECFGDTATAFAVGNEVIVRCERYLDFATICKVIGEPIEDETSFEKKRAQANKGRHIEGQKIPQIIRSATPEDKAQAEENNSKAKEAHQNTLERIRAHKLDMKLIHTHYAFDRKLLLFQFSAEGRVDFRELLRDLSSLFRSRVELRQVGVRDEAAILGGIGTCGRPFCCASFLPSFNSINVKMAKQQGLSLNPQNISGACGRLKCCLQYEAECYRAAAAEQKALAQLQGQGLAAPEDGNEDNREDDDDANPNNRPIVIPTVNPPVNPPKNPTINRNNRRSDNPRSDNPRSDNPRSDNNRNNRPPQSQRRQRPAGPLPPRNPNKIPLPPPDADGMNDRNPAGTDRVSPPPRPEARPEPPPAS